MICTVGYALNPKKLRKSGSDELPLQPVQAATVPSSSSQRLSSTYQPKSACSTENIWRGGGLADIIADGVECRGVKFIPWNYEVPISQQPEFDVIFHKLTEDIDRKESADKISALNAYLASHPKTVIVDPLEAVRKVISRARCCESLSNVINKLSTSCPFTQPKFVLVEADRPDLTVYILQLMAKGEFSFPVICKPVEACGTPNSHRMAVIVSPAGFDSMTPPFIVQEYRDHDEFFFKVYVIDNEVMIFRRPSLPNLDDLAVMAGNVRNPHNPKDWVGGEGGNGGGESHYVGLRNVAFDSRYAYPTAADFQDNILSNGDIHTNSCGQNYNNGTYTGSSHCVGNNDLMTIGHSSNSEGTSCQHSCCTDSCVGCCMTPHSGSNGVSIGHDKSGPNNGVINTKCVCERLVGREGPGSLAFAQSIQVGTGDEESSQGFLWGQGCRMGTNGCDPNGVGMGVGAGSEGGAFRNEISGSDQIPWGTEGTLMSSPPSVPREPLNRISVLSLEGRAKKPSAKDMPAVSAEHSPLNSSSSIQKLLQHSLTSSSKERVRAAGNLSSTTGGSHDIENGGRNGVCVWAGGDMSVCGAELSGASTEEKREASTDCAVLITPHSSKSCGRSVVASSRTLGMGKRRKSIAICEDKFRLAAMAIKEEFGLSLFGFDLIVPVRRTYADSRSGSGSGIGSESADSGSELLGEHHTERKNEIPTPHRNERIVNNDVELVVIDVNYFPSYKEVPDFPQRLRKFLRQKAGMD